MNAWSQKSTDNLAGLGGMRMRAAKEDGEKQIEEELGTRSGNLLEESTGPLGVDQEALCALVIPETALTLTSHDWSSTGTDDAWCL